MAYNETMNTIDDLLQGESGPVFQRESRNRFGGKSYLSRVEDKDLFLTVFVNQQEQFKDRKSTLAQKLNNWKVQLQAELSMEIKRVIATTQKDSIDQCIWKPTALDHKAELHLYFESVEGKLYCWSYFGTFSGLSRFGTGKDKRLSYPRKAKSATK